MFPVFREPFIGLLQVMWIVVKEFFLADIVKEVALYILIAGIITATGCYISDKKENKIWEVVAIILDIGTFIGYFVVYK